MAAREELGVTPKEAPAVANVVVTDKAEELNVIADGTIVDHGLHRALKQRHLQMIALGGVIGFVLSNHRACVCCTNDWVLEQVFGMAQDSRYHIQVRCVALISPFTILMRKHEVELTLSALDRCSHFLHRNWYRCLLRYAESRGARHPLPDNRRVHRTCRKVR